MIQIHNQSALPSDRWIRCTVRPQDIPNGARAWRQGTARFAVAKPVGIAAVEIDVRVPLAPGQRLTFDPAAGISETPVQVVLPTEAVRDPVGYFGLPTALSTVLEFQSATPEGAALQAVFRVRLRTAVSHEVQHGTQSSTDGFAEHSLAPEPLAALAVGQPEPPPHPDQDRCPGKLHHDIEDRPIQ